VEACALLLSREGSMHIQFTSRPNHSVILNEE